MTGTVTVPVHMTPEVFRKFANFDTFRVRKFMRNPLIFSAIMLAFAAVCFIFRDKAEQSLLLCGVLAGVGVLLPLVYVVMFELSVRQQVKKMELAKSPLVYTLTIGSKQNGVTINGTHGEKPVHLEWMQVHSAYRVKGCFYLYATPQKAFLLPEGQTGMTGDAFFALLKECLDGRVADCR